MAELTAQSLAKAVSLSVRSDGVYIVINKAGGKTVTRVDIMRIVEENKIKDVDFAAIGSIFKNTNTMFEVLISTNTNVYVSPETVKITVAPNGLTASATFTAPVNSPVLLTYDAFKAAIADAKVTHGLNDILLETVFTNREYGKPFVIAEGTLPIDGVNGYLIYHFDTNPKTYRPRERGDGTVDYKQVDLIDVVNNGDLLIEGIPPVEGTDGVTVTGKSIPYKPGKPHPPLLKTKNTKLTPDAHQLYAAESGQLVFKDNRVEVYPVLQVSGDVNHTTGNIDFVGSVVIGGNVLTGFTVKAAGSIEVRGVVEGARLEAGENISLPSGAQGKGQGVIHAKGSVTAKYIDQCAVYAGGDIITDFIVYCNVKCCGKIELIGKRGLLLGGRTTVKNCIIADTIGADLSASTEIELGFLPDEYEKYKTLLKELDEAKFELEKIENYEQMLNHRAVKGVVYGELDMQMTQSSFSKGYYEGQIQEIQQEIDFLTPDCGDEETCIIVKKALHTGVRVTIGSASTTIFETTGASQVHNTGGKIEVRNG